MIASVSGRRTVKVDPSPSTVLTSTLPRRLWMLRRTTSMPTPRPEMLVTWSAVEKPASKIRLMISWSESVAAGVDQPLGDRLGADLLFRQAAAVVDHLDDDAARVVVGVELHGAVLGFAALGAQRRRFDAVVDGVAHEMHQRVAEFLDDRFVEFGLGAGDHQVDGSCPSRARCRAPPG
jgi:hypothetical protein